MSETTTIRISRDTHARVTRLAAERHETVDQTVSKAIRALRQDAMARDLATYYRLTTTGTNGARRFPALIPPDRRLPASMM